MSDGDQSNEVTAEQHTAEDSAADVMADKQHHGDEGGEGNGNDGGAAPGEEGSDDVKIHEGAGQKAFGEEVEDEDGEEYDDEEEYEEDEGTPHPPPSHNKETI